MVQLDRRQFLNSAAGAAGAAACTVLGTTAKTSAAPASTAELVIMNGTVMTMNDQQPSAQAMAIRSGRILSVGSNQQIKPLISDTTEVIDLAGKSVTPGLIDAHSHVIGFGQMQLKYVILRPPKVTSFATLGRELAAAARETPAGEWIVGRGFEDFREGRFPRRWELDEAVSDHPVLIIHWGGQFGVANTMALENANLLRADAEDPYGGKFLRDRQTGLPDGVLVHYPAVYSVYQPTLDNEAQLECAAWGMAQFAAQGVTCIHDNFCAPAHARAYALLEQRGQLPCRVRVYPYVKNLEHCRLMLAKIRRYEGRLVRLQGIKLAVDGYALMYDVPRERRHLAIPMHPQGQFEEIVAEIHNADLQVDVHAVGDKGVDWTLAAFAKAAGSPARCRSRRHRIEHFPFRKLDSIRRAAELGVPVCLQPDFIDLRADHFVSQLGERGEKLVDSMLPLRTFMDEGVDLAFGADVPAFPSHSPLDSIRSAMERKTASGRTLDLSESVSFQEALRHHTAGGAHAVFDEEDLGTLEAGKYADFVIWTGDLDRVRSGHDVRALKPAATYLAGQAVYEST